MTYISLHAHSAYSVLDGHNTVDEYLDRIQFLGHSHAAITDHGTMSAMPEFFAAAERRGIVPIAGLEAYVVPGSRHVKDKTQRGAHHLTLLAIDGTGYRNLAKLSSIGWLEGFYYSPRIDHEALAAHAEGVVCLSGCIASEISQSILKGEEARTNDLVSFHHEVFGERFFLELQNHGRAVPDQIAVNRGLVALARKHGLPVVGTNDSHFCQIADSASQKLLMRVMNKDFGGGSPHTYVRDNEDMLRAFGDSAMLRNTLRIAGMVTPYQLGSSTPYLPASPLERPGETPAETLRRMCREGLLRRLDTDEFGVPLEYEARLDYELAVIAEMSRKLRVPFERYLLVIADLARHAEEQRIWFGPRGSAAGSICCWTLGVSAVDPVRYGLYFERFLNPSRIELPDVDMDFADDRRAEILDYLVATYGADQVARIATFQKIGAKSAIRDAAKVISAELSRDYKLLGGELADLVPESQHEVLLADLLADPAHPLNVRAGVDPDSAKVLEAAAKITGRFRGVGSHAAGIIVGDRPLDQIVPLMAVKDDTKAIAHQTQYDGDWLPKLGLLKLDVLGLTELTKMKQAVDLIERATGNRPDLWALPLDDAAAWDVLCAGKTSGLFQLGKPGMTRAIQSIAPRTIDELAMVCAAYRPGAIGNIPQIADRKHGREEVATLHPALEEVLRPTYGFPVFQEQVIEILVIIAGFSRGDADIVRKAIGKKIPALLEQYGRQFRDGAAAQGHAADAERIWSFIEPFAGYGFNKAHAYCYAFLAYQSAWLKANHPEEFYAACMDVEAKRSGKKGEANARQRIGLMASEARDHGVEVAPPDINRPSAEFRPTGGGTIAYGMAAIKGIGDKAAATIVRHAPYDDLADYVLRTPGVTKDVHLTLAKIGALPWGGRREQASKIERIVEARTKHQSPPPRKSQRETPEQAKARGAARVADLAREIAAEADPVAEYTVYEMLETEVDTMGIARSAFPRPDHVPVSGVVGALPDLLGEGTVNVAGMILSLSPFVTRKGDPMANGILLDDTGAVEILIWPRTYERVREWLKPGAFVWATGQLEVKRDSIAAEDSQEAVPLSSLKLKVEAMVNLHEASPADSAAPDPEPEPEHSGVRLPDALSHAEALEALADCIALAIDHPGTEPFELRWRGQTETLRLSALGMVLVEERAARTRRPAAA